MSNWVRVRRVSDGEIANWCNENYVTFQRRSSLVNPNTFETETLWYIADAKELILFKLRWSNTE